MDHVSEAAKPHLEATEIVLRDGLPRTQREGIRKPGAPPRNLEFKKDISTSCPDQLKVNQNAKHQSFPS